MDHLFHKNILQEKSNLEWQLAEANAKIEKLQRTLSTLSSLQEKKKKKDWEPGDNNADDAPSQPIQLPDGRWISPTPNRPLHPHTPYIAPWLDDDWTPSWLNPYNGPPVPGAPSQG